MKTKPSLHSNDKEGFIRAFTDEWADIELEYQVALGLEMRPSTRKGVIRIEVVAGRPADGHARNKVALYSSEYPTAAVESFEACLFRSLVQLERILQARYAYPLGKA